MTPQKDYRKRAAHVRRSARAQLKEIRRARLARKESDAVPAPMMDIDQTHEAAADTMSCPFEEPTAPPDADVHVEAGIEDIEPGLSGTQMSGEADSIENEALAELDDMFDDVEILPDAVVELVIEEPASQASEVADVLSDEKPPAEPEVEPVVQCSDQAGAVTEQEETALDNVSPSASPPDLEGSDLNSLPGAGPGLVWMLHQCGVSSLADLAVSDAAELTPKLGVVGQILDVSKWIDFATVETAAPN